VAHSLSAKKRIRQNIKRSARNRWRKRQVKGAIRDFERAVDAGELDAAAERLQQCYKVLDGVADKGIVHKNAAGRKKSRLARRLSRARAGA